MPNCDVALPVVQVVVNVYESPRITVLRHSSGPLADSVYRVTTKTG
ncbi:MAG: hypothetical protein RLY45_76, partial [Actinomycetota bacterium]